MAMSTNKVLSTFGVIFITLVVIGVPMVGFMLLIEKLPKVAIGGVPLFMFLCFGLKRLGDWVDKKYGEIK